MKNTASKSTLFLIELVIAILFFAISSAVCVQIFTKAHIYSSQTKEMNYASAKVNSIAAYVKTQDGDMGLIAQKAKGEAQGDVINFYYDENWQDVSKDDCTYSMRAKKVYGEQVQIEVYKYATKEKILGQNVAYHPPITLQEALK